MRPAHPHLVISPLLLALSLAQPAAGCGAPTPAPEVASAPAAQAESPDEGSESSETSEEPDLSAATQEALARCEAIPERTGEGSMQIGAVPASRWPIVHCQMRALMAEDACEIGEPPSLPRWEPPPARPLRGPLRRACARLAREARRALRAPLPQEWREQDQEIRAQNAEDPESEAYQEPPGDRVASVRHEIGRCVAAGEGAWALEAIEERFAPEEPSGPGERYLLRARPVYVEASGALRRGEEALELLAAFGAGDLLVRRYSFSAAYDFDGDGRTEAFLRAYEEDGGMGGAETRSRLMRAAEDGVRELPLPAGTRLGHLVDYDGDGRPDVLSPTPFFESECQMVSDPFPRPGALVHAADDGSLSADDAVAERWWRAVCPCAPSRLLARPGADPQRLEHPLYESQTLLRIACARAWGAEPEALLSRLDQELRALPDAIASPEPCAYGRSFFEHFLENPPPLRLQRQEAEGAEEPDVTSEESQP